MNKGKTENSSSSDLLRECENEKLSCWGTTLGGKHSIAFICTISDLWTMWIFYLEINEDCVLYLKSGNTDIDLVNICHWTKQNDRQPCSEK